MSLVYWYICNMKNVLEIEDHFPAAREKDLKAAAKRREDYSLVRDLRAKEENEAIARRLLRDKESKAEDKAI